MSAVPVPKVSCTRGGRCSHGVEPHWPVWAVLRGSVKRNTYRSFTATLLTRTPAFYYSMHKGASLVHRTKRGAAVFKAGECVMVAARALCGSESCLAAFVDTQNVIGLRPCARCEAVAA